MHAALNEFQTVLRDGMLWRFRANQTAYCQLEKATGLPMSRALSPAPLIDPETGMGEVSRTSQLQILYALTTSHRAQEAIRMRFMPSEADLKDGFRGPYFTDIVPGERIQSLFRDAWIAIRADMGLAEVYDEDAEGDDSGK